MRRLATIAIPVSLVVLTACDGSNTPSSSAPVKPATTSAAPQTSAPASKVNPCTLVTASDITKILKASSVEQVAADDADPSNPPVTGSFNERNCVYFVTVPGIYGDNPLTDSGAQLSITITTHEDNAAGEQWAATKKGGQLAAEGGTDLTRTEYRPVTNIGDEAFFAGVGWLNAHKDDVLVEVNSTDDTNNILNDTTATAIVLQAFAHIR